jgi:putative ATP-binding cassette transporter
VSRLLSTLATIWRLARPYFVSEDRLAGCLLLGAVVTIELAIVAINVMLNQWNNRFYNALQDRDWDSFVWELLFFCALAAAFIVLAVYQLYLNQWLQIRWRRWMTQQYLDHWLGTANHYRMQLLGDAADNPDQRIAEDINMFVDRTLSITVGLLSAVVTLASFVTILWTLSAIAPLRLFGATFNIPGYLVWAISASSGSRPTFVSISCGCGRIPSRSRSCAARPPSASGCSTASDAWSAISCRSCSAPNG